MLISVLFCITIFFTFAKLKVFSNRLLLVVFPFRHSKQAAILCSHSRTYSSLLFSMRLESLLTPFCIKSPCFLSINSSVFILLLIGRFSLGFLSLIAHTLLSSSLLSRSHRLRTVLTYCYVKLWSTSLQISVELQPF